MKTSITYYLRRKKYIYCTIRLNGFEFSRSTGISIDNPDSWTGQFIIDHKNKAKAAEINSRLSEHTDKVESIITNNRHDKTLTPLAVFEMMDGADSLLSGVPLSLIQSCELYVREQSQLKSFSVHTVKGYESTIVSIKKFLKEKYKIDDLALSGVNHIVAKDFKMWLREKYSGDTEFQYLIFIKAVINYVLEEYHPEQYPNIGLKVNPFRSKKMTGKGMIQKSTRITKYCPPAKEAELWEKYDALPDSEYKDHLFLALLIWNTGLSIGDLCSEVEIMKDINNGDLFSYYRKKTKKQARVIIYDELKNLLDIAEHKRGEWMDKYDNWLPVKRFVVDGVEDYTMYRYVKNRLHFFYRRLSTDLSVHITPHLLRHSFAVKMLEKGHSMDVVAKFLGDTISTTERHYGFITNDQILREKEIILNRKSV